MGFFSKHKKEEDNAAIAPPPVPQTDSSAPPAPPGDIAPPPIPNLQEGSTLTPPPIPGGNFDDIKNQVVNETPGFREDSASSLPPPQEVPGSIPEVPGIEDLPSNDSSSDFGVSDDSLFDLSDLEGDSSVPEIPKVSQGHEIVSEEHAIPEVHDTNMERGQDFSFISSKNVSGRAPQGSFFVTTQQFREMMDIVDSVKGRVKEANDTHLRLLDIKSEEDIEYENLRKDFQYIEDKLYELDSLVFEK